MHAYKAAPSPNCSARRQTVRHFPRCSVPNWSGSIAPRCPVPRCHWRSYGDHPLPSGAEALDEPLRAFPSWFLRIVCERCGKVRMVIANRIAASDREDARAQDVAQRVGDQVRITVIFELNIENPTSAQNYACLGR
jgi:hypothetical protein